MIFYVTYNDAPSGIYSSQVIDVVKFIGAHLEKKIRLVAFISIRNFKRDKAKIKAELSDAIVLPMFPKLANWRYNKFLLRIYCRLLKPEMIIGRSVIATELALVMRKKKLVNRVIYDGRGAIAAEWKEYGVVSNFGLVQNIGKWEKEVVVDSDYRIAVSDRLIEYWKNNYNYIKKEHSVIPCTINKTFELIDLTAEGINIARKKFNFNEDDVVFIYSGSLAGWQSFDYLNTFLKKLLNGSIKNKVLFLSDKDSHIINLQQLFPKQVFNEKLSPQEVASVLISGDYGFLLREQSVTNKVASPVKFAEYLACGLKVIISDNLGDYSNLIRKNVILGSVLEEGELVFSSIDINEKILIRNFGLNHYTKNALIREYQKVVK